MANSRTTFGAILGTITTLANTVTSTLDTIDTSIGMVATTVDDAARRQAARSKLDALAYKQTIATEKAMELEVQKAEVNDWLGDDEDRKTSFNTTYQELMAALA